MSFIEKMDALGTATRRQRQKAETRRVLLDAARRCFCERGFDGTTIGDIARAADVAPGTIYVHFATKEALVDELLARFTAEIASVLAPLFAAAGTRPLQDSVEELAEVFFDLWEHEAAFVRVYVQRSGHGIDDHAFAGGVNPQMAPLLARAMEMSGQGVGGQIDLELIAQGLMAMWLRIGLQLLYRPEVTREHATRTLVAMTVGALSHYWTRDPEKGER
ncbi:MAG: TetR/AcrR family transcriptional regulator [Deltaproteobacteria bacterium]|nr:TetR/AcrR family transcriptional regulator [Deltaproteobacteria bacterium]